MAAKKIIPRGYDQFKLGISFRLQGGQAVMQFSDSVDWVRMTAGGAPDAGQRCPAPYAGTLRCGVANHTLRTGQGDSRMIV